MVRGSECNLPERGAGHRVLAMSLAAGAVAATFVAADGWLGKRKWPSTPTKLIGPPKVTKAMITFSGLGSMGGQEQSEQIGRIFKWPGAHWEYSTDKYSVTLLANQLHVGFPDLMEVGINGHSMGGPTGLETVCQGTPRGAKLGPVILHCSPFDYRDGRNHKAAKILDVVRLPTGPASKAAFTMVRNALEGTPPWKSWKEAVTNATTGCSPRLWMQQMRALQAVDLPSRRDDIARMVGEDTQVIYCMPEEPEMDRTVDTVQASERYMEYFEGMGVPVDIVRVPDAGHADVTRACAQLALRAA